MKKKNIQRFLIDHLTGQNRAGEKTMKKKNTQNFLLDHLTGQYEICQLAGLTFELERVPTREDIQETIEEEMTFAVPRLIAALKECQTDPDLRQMVIEGLTDCCIKIMEDNPEQVARWLSGEDPRAQFPRIHLHG